MNIAKGMSKMRLFKDLCIPVERWLLYYSVSGICFVCEPYVQIRHATVQDTKVSLFPQAHVKYV